MDSETDLLSELKVASPCNASWDEMRGDEKVRFCQHCQLNVYNLSALSRREAEALVKEKEGRLCVRFYQRRDGTVLTRNCPVGFRALRRALLTQFAAITGVFALLFSSAPLFSSERRHSIMNSWLGQREPVKSLLAWIDSLAARVDPQPPVVMGDVAMPVTSPVTPRNRSGAGS